MFCPVCPPNRIHTCVHYQMQDTCLCECALSRGICNAVPWRVPLPLLSGRNFQKGVPFRKKLRTRQLAVEPLRAQVLSHQWHRRRWHRARRTVLFDYFFLRGGFLHRRYSKPNGALRRGWQSTACCPTRHRSPIQAPKGRQNVVSRQTHFQTNAVVVTNHVFFQRAQQRTRLWHLPPHVVGKGSGQLHNRARVDRRT